MIKFMVLGGPRSATTWCANWLTTDTTMCLHDPLLEYTRRNLDLLTVPGKQVGISCTSALLFPEWLEKHPAPKVVLYRPIEEINMSLEQLGLPVLDPAEHHKRIRTALAYGAHLYYYEDVFRSESAQEIWKHLLPHVPFDYHRHDLMAQFNVQPQFRRLPVSKDAVADLVQRSKEVLI